MKSIKQQYTDLREGNMSQANFMRNLRMTLPQYVTNVTSFNDSVRILKNKGILTEADISPGPNAQWLGSIKDIIKDKWQNGEIKTPAEYGSVMTKLSTQPEDIIAQYGETSAEDAANRLLNSVSHLGSEYYPGPGEDEDFERDYDTNYEEPNEPFGMAESLKEAKDEKGKWTNADGKSMYDQFDEINIVNGQELLIGIDYEMIKNYDLSKEKATKIAIKKIKQVPNYYTMAGLAGVEGAEPEYIGGKSANAEARQMQYLDKNMGNVVDKVMGMKPVKDVEKFKKDSTTGGETNKVVKGVETTSFIAKTVRGVQKMNATGEKMKKIAMKEELNYSQSNLKLTPEETAKIKRVLPDAEFEWDEDDRKQVVYSNKSEREIRNIVNQATGQAPVPSNTIRPGIGDAIQNKLTKESLMKMIREEIKEITGAYGGDAMSAEDGSSYM